MIAGKKDPYISSYILQFFKSFHLEIMNNYVSVLLKRIETIDGSKANEPQAFCTENTWILQYVQMQRHKMIRGKIKLNGQNQTRIQQFRIDIGLK